MRSFEALCANKGETASPPEFRVEGEIKPADDPATKTTPNSARSSGGGKPKRRRFTAQYKRSILEQADACSQSGELSALLRREGLYSSHLHTWRLARQHGELAGLAPKKRGPKPKKLDPRDQRIAKLEKELAKERARRKQAEGLVELQKKVAALFDQLPKDETP